jgi:hypothetical protein
MMQVITSAVAILVGLVIYKERAVNLVTISAVWLGFFMLLLISGGQPLPQFLVWPMLGASVAALFVLGKRFPMFGLFLIFLIMNLITRGRYYPYYYPYRRRWW